MRHGITGFAPRRTCRARPRATLQGVTSAISAGRLVGLHVRLGFARGAGSAGSAMGASSCDAVGHLVRDLLSVRRTCRGAARSLRAAGLTCTSARVVAYVPPPERTLQ